MELAQRKRLRIVAAVLLLLFTPGMAVSSEINPFRQPLYDGSVSFSDSGFSHLINPVFTDVPESSYFSYRYNRYEDEKKGNHFAALKVLGFSLTYGRFSCYGSTESAGNTDSDSHYYNISRGFFFGNLFGFGAGYSFSRSDHDNYDSLKSWDFGLLLRPFSFISLGAVFRDYDGKTGGGEIKRSEIYSISIRPYGNRLTLSSDALRYSGENYRDMDYSYSISMRIPYELSFFLRGDREKNFMFGLTLPFYMRKGNIAGLKLEGYGSRTDEKSPDFIGVGFSYTDSANEKAIVSAPGRNMLMVRIAESYNETEIRSFFGERKLVFYDLIRGMDEALGDRTIDGLILRIDQAELGFAQLQELRGIMKKFRDAGKQVVSILTATGNKEYFLASESDRIYLSPNAPFGLRGLKAEVYFFKKLADSAGIRFESIRRGRYKSFSEPWTREKMSPEFRENMNQVLGDLNEQFLGSISGSRGISRKDLNEILSKGVLTPEEAKEKNVVDKVMYPHEAIKDIGSKVIPVDLKQYLDENKTLHTWGPVPVIAVIYVDGSIIKGKSRISRYTRGIGDESYAEVLERIFGDSSVKAVVLRVDSGGGSAEASDFMWRSLTRLKEKYKKPVVISFGNIAASGGYYIACTGDRIYSSPGTITGSIGVVFGKLSLSELYGKLGINKEVIKMDRFADIMSESRRLTDEEKKILQKGIDFIYGRFLDKVKKARKIGAGKIESVAEGRVFTGNQAGKNRLVDEMGGLLTAIEYAKALTGIERKFAVLSLPEYTTFMDGIIQTKSLGPLGSFFSRLYGDSQIDLLLNSDYLYLFPYVLKIR